MPQQIRRNRTQTFIAAIVVSLLSGINYVWSLTSASLVADHGWTSTQASLPYSLFTVTASVLVLFGGRFIDKRPPRQLVLLAGICYAVGLLGASFSMSNTGLFTVCYGVILACGTGCITASTVGPTVKWFPYRQRGIVSAVLYTATGMCSVYMSPLCNALVTNYGVQTTLVTFGISFGLIIIISHFFIRTPDVDLIHKMEIEEAATVADSVTFEVREYSWTETLRSGRFWLIWLTFTGLCLTGLMVISNVTSIASLQAGWAGGYLLLVLNALFSCAGRLACGPLAVKIGFKRVWIIMLILQIINMACFRFYTTVPTLLIGAAIGGACFGGIWSIAPSIVSGEFGKKNNGVNFGLLHTGYAVGGLVGPIFAGYFRDTYGNYNYAYILAIGFLAVGLVSALCMKKDIGQPKPID